MYPCDEPRPATSNLNLTPGVISANLVISHVEASLYICLFTQRSAHLVVDMVGLFLVEPTFTAIDPLRLVDTRAESQIGYTGAQPTAGQVLEVAAPPSATR